MSTASVASTITKAPFDRMVLVFDWDEHVTVGASLLDPDTFTVEDITYPREWREETPALEIDNIEFVAGSTRKVQFRINGGTEMHVYRIYQSVDTNETPAQARERSFYVWVKRK